jgi:pyruvate dehydrogenase E1 component beta subunit
MNMPETPVRDLTLVEALNMALDRALAEDPNVVVLGEDVGVNGGVFRTTDHLREKYGLKHVMDTPLAETVIAGMAIGMAAQGLRPVAEIQFMGFINATLEQLICHAARLRNRTRGRLQCPLVVRAPFGGGIQAPEHHSESTEALFAHIPGLRVVIPSSPAKAYGLLLSAVRCNDPVIFLEPKRIYRSNRSRVSDDGKGLPLDRCFVLREGSDITLISWGAVLTEVMSVAEQLAGEGVSCEVLDLVSIAPLDRASILASVRKTGRCVIVHEAPGNGGVGAEISATISEHLLPWLKAPVARVTGYDTVMPYFRNERHYLPGCERIRSVVNACLNGVERVERHA